MHHVHKLAAAIKEAGAGPASSPPQLQTANQIVLTPLSVAAKPSSYVESRRYAAVLKHQFDAVAAQSEAGLMHVKRTCQWVEGVIKCAEHSGDAKRVSGELTAKWAEEPAPHDEMSHYAYACAMINEVILHSFQATEKFRKSAQNDCVAPLHAFYKAAQIRRRDTLKDYARMQSTFSDIEKALAKERAECVKAYAELRGCMDARDKEDSPEPKAKLVKKAKALKEAVVKRFEAFEKSWERCAALQKSNDSVSLPTMLCELENLERERLAHLSEYMTRFQALFSTWSGEVRSSADLLNKVAPALQPDKAVVTLLDKWTAVHGPPPALVLVRFDLPCTSAHLTADNLPSESAPPLAYMNSAPAPASSPSSSASASAAASTPSTTAAPSGSPPTPKNSATPFPSVSKAPSSGGMSSPPATASTASTSTPPSFGRQPSASIVGLPPGVVAERLASLGGPPSKAPPQLVHSNSSAGVPPSPSAAAAAAASAPSAPAGTALVTAAAAPAVAPAAAAATTSVPVVAALLPLVAAPPPTPTASAAAASAAPGASSSTSTTAAPGVFTKNNRAPAPSLPQKRKPKVDDGAGAGAGAGVAGGAKPALPGASLSAIAVKRASASGSRASMIMRAGAIGGVGLLGPSASTLSSSAASSASASTASSATASSASTVGATSKLSKDRFASFSMPPQTRSAAVSLSGPPPTRPPPARTSISMTAPPPATGPTLSTPSASSAAAVAEPPPRPAENLPAVTESTVRRDSSPTDDAEDEEEESEPRAAEALFDFRLDEDTADIHYISFTAGEIIQVYAQEEEWWYGETAAGDCGFFAAAYVKFLDEPATVSAAVAD